MSFRASELLWLLAAMPFALWFAVERESRRRSVARRFIAERLRGIAVPARAARPWLIGAGMLGLVLALAGPHAGYTIVPVSAREASRVLVLDVSNSMGAEDVGSSRLTAAKAVAVRLANAQQGRVGVVVFEGEAEIVSPLTTDTGAVAALVETLQPGELGVPGSDLGGAVLAALQLIANDPTQQADVVVITDGEDQGGRAEEAAARAKERGVRVSAVLIGSAAGSAIPTPRGPLRNESGEIVTTYARSERLDAIAAATGGRVLGNPFGSDALVPLEGGVAGAMRETQTRVPIDRYQWPLSIAFAVMLGASLLHRGAE